MRNVEAEVLRHGSVPAFIFFPAVGATLCGGRPVLRGADGSAPGEQIGRKEVPGLPKIGGSGYPFTINADLMKLFPQSRQLL
jgi:hypothetical protein